MRALAIGLVAIGAIVIAALARRGTGSTAVRADEGASGAGTGEVADGASPAVRDHRRLVGCLGAGAGLGFLVLAVPLVLVVLLARACDGADWVFEARVARIDESEICLQLLDDGPAGVDGCTPTEDLRILGLPSGIVEGECLKLRAVHDGDLVYERRTACS